MMNRYVEKKILKSVFIILSMLLVLTWIASVSWGKSLEKSVSEDAEKCWEFYRSGYSTRYYLERNVQKKLTKWKEAQEKGIPAGLWIMGRCHQWGVGEMEIDLARAVKLYEQAVEAGYTKAMYALGLLYYHGGWPVEKDEEKGAALLQQAAHLGNKTALANLGLKFNSISLLEKSQSKGNLRARQYMAHFLWNISPYGQADVLELYKQLSDNETPLGMYWYATLLIQEDENNRKKAETLFKKAYQSGHSKAGEKLADGALMRNDVNAALDYYSQSALWGNKDAAFKLAQIYENGSYGVKKDNLSAFAYYNLSARLGHMVAANHLFDYLITEETIKRDIANNAPGRLKATVYQDYIMVIAARVQFIRERYARLWEKRAVVSSTTIRRENNWIVPEQTFINRQYNYAVIQELIKLNADVGACFQLMDQCRTRLPEDNIYAKRAKREISQTLPPID